MSKTLLKIPQEKALTIIGRYQTGQEIKKEVDPRYSPGEVIEYWLQQEKYNEIVTFLCHALPTREAIWWGCLCVRLAARDASLPDDQWQALEAAESWVRSPSEANRRVAEALAQRIGLESAAAWLAQSAFWSGGSITPQDGPPCQAPPYLYAHSVAGAIAIAAILPDGNKAKRHFKEMIRMGMDIANGGNGDLSHTQGQSTM